MTEELIKKFMREALLEAKNSPDPSTQNGAIIVYYCGTLDTYEVVGRGCNTFHKGIKHKLDRENKGLFIEHAERMAIQDMFQNLCYEYFSFDSDFGDKLIMFCTDAPCANCANSIVGHRISKVYTFNPQREGSRWKDSCDAGEAIIKSTGSEIIYLGSEDKYGVELLKSGKLKEY